VYLTTGADDTKGVIINAADKVLSRRIYVANGVSNKILKVYPPSGGTINGGAADAGVSSASGKGVALICTSTSGSGAWAAF
jgi:20S proteasome alpha/beta subunit